MESGITSFSLLAGDICIVASKHVSDAVFEARKIGLGRVTITEKK